MAAFRYRLIDTAGSELGLIDHDDPRIGDGQLIDHPELGEVEVLEVYDDEHGREGGVQATLVVAVE